MIFKSLFSKKSTKPVQKPTFKDFAAQTDEIVKKIASLEKSSLANSPSSNNTNPEKERARLAADESAKLLKQTAGILEVLLPSNSSRQNDSIYEEIKKHLSELASLCDQAIFNYLVIERDILPLAKELCSTVEKYMY